MLEIILNINNCEKGTFRRRWASEVRRAHAPVQSESSAKPLTRSDIGYWQRDADGTFAQARKDLPVDSIVEETVGQIKKIRVMMRSTQRSPTGPIITQLRFSQMTVISTMQWSSFYLIRDPELTLKCCTRDLYKCKEKSACAFITFFCLPG